MATTALNMLTLRDFTGKEPGPGDDPRGCAVVQAKDILVDQNVQRDVADLPPIGEIDWNKFEAITVAVRPDGQLVAVEGQRRVLGLMEQDPDAFTYVMVLPDGVDEPGTALGIAQGRRALSPLAKWRLRLGRGEEIERRGETVLADNGLFLWVGDSAHDGIAAVGSVIKVMRLGSTPAEGAKILDLTLSVILSAWPQPEKRRLDGKLLEAVGRIIARNSHISPLDLTRALQQWPAYKWREMGEAHTPQQPVAAAVGAAILETYNKGKPETSAKRARW